DVAEILAGPPTCRRRVIERQGEAIVFAVDGRGFVTISEGEHPPVLCHRLPENLYTTARESRMNEYRHDRPARSGGVRLGGGGVRDADATGGGGAVAALLGGQVEGADGRAGGEGLVVDEVGRHQPRHLELDAVGVAGVDRLGGPVVAGADQR